MLYRRLTERSWLIQLELVLGDAMKGWYKN